MFFIAIITLENLNISQAIKQNSILCHTTCRPISESKVIIKILQQGDHSDSRQLHKNLSLDVLVKC